MTDPSIQPDRRSVVVRLQEHAQEIRDSWCDCEALGSTSEWHQRDMVLAHLLDEAASRIEQLDQDATRLAQRNTVLVSEIDRMRESFRVMEKLADILNSEADSEVKQLQNALYRGEG